MGTLSSPTEAVDLSHHINKRSKARHPSPLKDIIKFMNQDGMISLAGGKNAFLFYVELILEKLKDSQIKDYRIRLYSLSSLSPSNAQHQPLRQRMGLNHETNF